tara:strand:+ start:193 stop:741 length:549 start_codon:yes stop_codon:yes gene_type:complete
MWITPQDLSGTSRLLDISGRSYVAIVGDTLVVYFKDHLNSQVYSASTTNAAFSVGVKTFIGIQIDLSVPSVAIQIGASNPALTVSVPLIGGTGLLALARGTGLLAYEAGTSIANGLFSDIYMERSTAVSLATLYNGGTPPDLSAVGSPYVRLGGAQVASNWNAFENLGTATLVAGSGTFTNV